MQESVRTAVSLWICACAGSTFPLLSMSSPVSSHHCVHQAPELEHDMFMKMRGKPVYRCWISNKYAPGTHYAQVAVDAVFPTRRLARLAADKLGLVGKRVVLRAEKLPDPPLPKDDAPCDRCPVRCRWPGCAAVYACQHDLTWHQAGAHGVWHTFREDPTRCWLPPEMWAKVADQIPIANIHQVRDLIRVLWVSKSSPLIAELRARVRRFLRDANVELASQPCLVTTRTQKVLDHAPHSVAFPTSFAGGLLTHCREPVALLAYLRLHLPIEPGYAGVKHIKASETAWIYVMEIREGVIATWCSESRLVCQVDAMQERGGRLGVEVLLCPPRTADKGPPFSALLEIYWTFVIRLLGVGSLKRVKKITGFPRVQPRTAARRRIAARQRVQYEDDFID